jgi:hypothetical protein
MLYICNQEPYATFYFFFHPLTWLPTMENVHAKESMRAYTYMLE